MNKQLMNDYLIMQCKIYGIPSYMENEIAEKALQILTEMGYTLIQTEEIDKARQTSYRDAYKQGRFDERMEYAYGKPKMINVDSRLEKQYRVEFNNGSVIEGIKSDNVIRGHLSNYYFNKD